MTLYLTIDKIQNEKPSAGYYYYVVVVLAVGHRADVVCSDRRPHNYVVVYIGFSSREVSKKKFETSPENICTIPFFQNRDGPFCSPNRHSPWGN